MCENHSKRIYSPIYSIPKRIWEISIKWGSVRDSAHLNVHVVIKCILTSSISPFFPTDGILYNRTCKYRISESTSRSEIVWFENSLMGNGEYHQVAISWIYTEAREKENHNTTDAEPQRPTQHQQAGERQCKTSGLVTHQWNTHSRQERTEEGLGSTPKGVQGGEPKKPHRQRRPEARKGMHTSTSILSPKSFALRIVPVLSWRSQGAGTMLIIAPLINHTLK